MMDRATLLKKLIALDLPAGKSTLVLELIDLLLDERKPKKAPSDWPENYAEIFRNAYPRKDTMAAALRKLETVSRLIKWEVFKAGLDRDVIEFKARERKYIPQPLTWVNQIRWQDPRTTTINGVPFDAAKLTKAQWKRVLELSKFEAATMSTNRWNEALYGPPPGAKGCRVPEDLLK